jgi:2-(1,2-epoxy-1,2-dihydrophenyl)acetyl-CoA isomerase
MAAVALTFDGPTARLTLTSPATRNALDLEAAEALLAAAQELGARADVGAVLLSAEGEMFCPGGRLDAFAEAEDPADYVARCADAVAQTLLVLAGLEAPVVTAVQGTAAGGGVGLALSGDLVLLAESAKLTLAYTKAGLTPDGGATWLLPRVVGLRRAMELALLNPVVGAQEAVDLGLVTRVVPDAQLQDEAEALVARLAAGPRRAQAATKRLLLQAGSTGMAEQLDAETQSIAAQAGGPEGREGIAAFLGKRAPDWSATAAAG